MSLQGSSTDSGDVPALISLQNF